MADKKTVLADEQNNLGEPKATRAPVVVDTPNQAPIGAVVSADPRKCPRTGSDLPEGVPDNAIEMRPGIYVSSN
jgi:hypothetical protein